jgi:hypothetical protein
VTPVTLDTTAGQFKSFTVSAVDTSGAILTTYQGTVAFVSIGTDLAPMLPASYTFTAGDGGSHTFSAKYFTAGSQILGVFDITNLAFGTTTVVVSPGAFDHLIVNGLSATTPIGVQNTITVTAVDAFNNIVPGFNDTIKFSSNDGLAQLPADAKLTNGVGTFSVTFRGLLPIAQGQSVRLYQVTATDRQRPSKFATQTVALPLYLLPSPVQFVEVENVGFSNQLVATFLSDLANGAHLSADDFTATIDWGDNTDIDQGTIVLGADGTTFSVFGSHTYPTGQTDYPVDVTITFAGFSSQPVTPSVAAAVTAEQFANLSDSLVTRAVGGQTTLTLSTQTADAHLNGADATQNTTLFVANYVNNPQPGTQVAGVSYYDIRTTNPTSGAMLTVTFRFPTGTGVPQLQYFDPTTGKYVPVVGVSMSAPTLVAPGIESVTVVFDTSSFPRLTDLQGSVFTIVLAALPVSTTTTINPALSLALTNVPGSDLTVTRDVSFQGSGVRVGLTPSQDATLSVGRADLSGGGGDEITEADLPELDAILNVLGFGPAEGAPTGAPVAAPAPAPATPRSEPTAVGPGAFLPPTLPADALFATLPADAVFVAASEKPFVFELDTPQLEQLSVEPAQPTGSPCLLAAPLLGALAAQPPIRTSNRKQRRGSVISVG